MPHPRNAGYRRGENWQCCPVCGNEYRARDFKRRWDGQMVCKWDWEPRHPQDFLKVSPDDMTPAVSTGACCGAENVAVIPTIGFSDSEGEFSEDGIVTVERNVTNFEQTVDYTFVDLEAENSVDYTGVDGTLNLTAGQTVADVPFTVEPLELVTEYANEVLYPWLVGEILDPRNPLNNHVYTGFGAEEVDFQTALDTMNASINQSEDRENLVGWCIDADRLGNPGFTQATGHLIGRDPNNAPNENETETGSLTRVNLAFTVTVPDGDYLHQITPGGLTGCSPDLYEAPGAYFTGYISGAGNLQGGIVYVGPIIGNGFPDYVDATYCGAYSGTSNTIKGETSRGFAAIRTPGAPQNPCDGFPALPENSDYCVLGDGSITRDQDWTLSNITNGYKVLQRYADSDGIVTHFPLSPALPVGHEDDTEAFWTAAYNAAVAAGTMEAGYTYDAEGNGGLTTYPRLQSYAYTRSYYPFKNFRIDLSNPQGGAVIPEPGSITIRIVPEE